MVCGILVSNESYTGDKNTGFFSPVCSLAWDGCHCGSEGVLLGKTRGMVKFGSDEAAGVAFQTPATDER